MGIPSVAVYSEIDRAAMHVLAADEAVCIGEAPSSESYLRTDRILDAAQRYSADAIHPGYGFLSENPDFAEACEQAGLTFIGPSSASIRAMGSKLEARRLAIAAGTPVVPGTQDPVTGFEDARHIAAEIGYPVMIKAAAGGGGKGMRRVSSEAELEAALRNAASEASRAFQNGEVYIEKLIEKPRHIEIQVLGDHHGNMVHLGERECSIQRRYQKVIEESPSPFAALHPGLRERMGEAAIRAARGGGYYNAGTVEFIVDADANFYFLEMNTRLQVEHPVTELVTGLDLVQLQIRIASGEPLPFRQEDISWKGAAIECRIYAEDPYNGFFPSPGKITSLEWPSGPGIRLDAGVYPGWTVPMEYDPLLAKLAVWAPNRQEAIARMYRAVSECRVSGIETTAPFFREILRDADFQRGAIHTGFIEEFLARRSSERPPLSGQMVAAALVAAVRSRPLDTSPVAPVRTSDWLLEGRSRLLR